jgi:dephospho-CoA kinase
MDSNISQLEDVLNDVRQYEKLGLDTSYLKLFIKNYKLFLKLNNIETEYSESNRFKILEEILNNRQLFPTISDIIYFSNYNLGVEFKSQKASREITINRIIKRAEKDESFKNVLKSKLSSFIAEGHYKEQKTMSTVKPINYNDLEQWAKMLKDI